MNLEPPQVIWKFCCYDLQLLCSASPEWMHLLPHTPDFRLNRAKYTALSHALFQKTSKGHLHSEEG